jgi:hypothetical protein
VTTPTFRSLEMDIEIQGELREISRLVIEMHCKATIEII